MLIRPTRRRIFAWLAAAAMLPVATQAQEWPSKPIRLVVPYAAGGPTDVIARLLAMRMSGALGQTITVDNRTGAGGVIGVDATAKAAPDGYTFALVAPGPLVGMPNLTKTPYGLDDLQYITQVARIPSVLVVSTKSGMQTLEQFIQKARAEPDKLTYSSAGSGTTPHIGMELLKDAAGLKLLHVPYKGAAPAITAVLSGEVSATMVDLLPVLPHVASGALRVLAVAGGQRAPQLPEVPTTREKNLPTVAMETVYGLIGPKDVPAAIATRWRAAAVDALGRADVKQLLLQQGAEAVVSMPAEYQRLMRAESEKWRLIIAKANITLD